LALSTLPSSEEQLQLCVLGPREKSVFDPDIALVGFILFLAIAALLFPGGPGTPRRLPVEH